MTEEEWLTGTATAEMVKLVRVGMSERTLRLFICAAVRRDPDAQRLNARRSVDLGELRADGLAGPKDVTAFNRKSRLTRGSQWLALSTDPPATLDLIVRSAGDKQAPHLPPLLRDIFGNPFRPVALDPAWLTSTAVALAEGIYADKAFDRMPILADALQDAVCDSTDILSHCREPGEHVRGCWVVDLLLGKQ